MNRVKEALNATFACNYGCDPECADRKPSEELDYINHKLTMGEVIDKEIAEHPEELASLKEALFPDEDPVNHPNHYVQDGIETIDVIKAWTKGLDGIIATDTGNVIKYISRWNKKNGIEDLRKAQWYLNHLIKEMEERMENDCCC
jgi:hypothetical protein